MQDNQELLTGLFRCLNAHDPNGMADCYGEDATFQDIAFTLQNKREIRAMWDMICSDNKERIKSDIEATVQELSADGSTGRAVVVDNYTFRDTGRKVRNRIVSTFWFRDGKIIKQTDECDSVDWAHQAFGGIQGYVAGHVAFIRRGKAMKKLRAERPQAFSLEG